MAIRCRSLSLIAGLSLLIYVFFLAAVMGLGGMRMPSRRKRGFRTASNKASAEASSGHSLNFSSAELRAARAWRHAELIRSRGFGRVTLPPAALPAVEFGSGSGSNGSGSVLPDYMANYTCQDLPEFSKANRPQVMFWRNVSDDDGGVQDLTLAQGHNAPYLVAGCTVATHRQPKLAVRTPQVWFEVHGYDPYQYQGNRSRILRKVSHAHDVLLALKALQRARCFGHDVVVWAEDDVELCDGAALHLEFVANHVLKQRPYLPLQTNNTRLGGACRTPVRALASTA